MLVKFFRICARAVFARVQLCGVFLFFRIELTSAERAKRCSAAGGDLFFFTVSVILLEGLWGSFRLEVYYGEKAEDFS